MEINENNEQLDFKKLKKEIAVKHGYNLPDDDPILMFVTLNEFMLNQYKTAFDETLCDLSDILTNIKTDINFYIKENEMELFKKIQIINNDNVSKVHTRIRRYFEQEAETININNLYQKNKSSLLLFISILNSICIFVIMLKMFNFI